MLKPVKKIGIDCRSMSIGGGVKTYLTNLINELGKFDKKNKYFLYYDSEKNLDTFKFKNFKEIVLKNRYKFLIPYWEQIRLKNRVIKDEIDVFHGTKNTISLFLPKKIKKIITIHDLTPFLFGNEMNYLDLIYWRIIIPKSLKVTDKIISISNSTKDDLIRLFPDTRKKITVVYHGSHNSQDGNVKIMTKKEEVGKFFLMVGAIRPRKNIERVLLAMSKISNKNFKLYIVGKNLNYIKKIKKLIKDCNLTERVILKGYVSDEELNILYSTAIAYIYPSLYEGFGLPILEAQLRGLPVITSNNSSMPEVAGDGAFFVDPYSVDDIRNAMEQLIQDKVLRERLINNGHKNIQKFLWETCAIETLKIYE